MEGTARALLPSQEVVFVLERCAIVCEGQNITLNAQNTYPLRPMYQVIRSRDCCMR